MRQQLSVALIAAVVATGCATVTPRVPTQTPATRAPLAAVPSTPAKLRRHSFIPALGVVTATTVNVTARVDGQLMSIVDGRPVKAGEWLATIESSQMRARQPPADMRVRAPISGLAGFREVDPRNFVHAGETLLTITRLQPIAVVFPIAESYLPRVRALLESGTTPVVEVFNANGTVRLTTGHITAINNEIDPSTGTIKLRASFANTDGSLFPNQFVNVRLLLGARESNQH
jgi:membrane fusion protein, multidrug efflux system